MDSEIKQRIEMVRRGEVPEGYKKIQRDIIPKDWTIKSLAEVGNNFSYGMNAAAKAYDGHNKYIRITDIDDNTHIYTGLDLVSPHADLELKYRVQENDILFARTGATVGKTYLYNKNDGILFFAGFLIRVNIPIDNSYYVYEQTLTGRYLNWIRIMSQRSGQPGINAQEYGTYSFPYCCVKEQQKIAAILTTQDKAIELKEKRLAEKQRQKKYLMQQLLTGKKRLPGFNKTWNTVELGEIFDYIQPTKYLVKTTDYDNAYKTPVLTAGKTFILGYTSETKDVYTNVPVVIFDDFTTATQYVDFPFKVKSSALKILAVKDGFNIFFAYEAMQLIRFAVGGHERHWISQYSCLTVDVPEIGEQTAIAQVLSTADREISLLRQGIEQEKQKKKALMQLLLTGIVRTTA